MNDEKQIRRRVVSTTFHQDPKRAEGHGSRTIFLECGHHLNLKASVRVGKRMLCECCERTARSKKTNNFLFGKAAAASVLAQKARANKAKKRQYDRERRQFETTSLKDMIP